MKGINFSKKEFIGLIGKVFIPILIIVIIVGIILFLYKKNAEKKGIKGYNSRINFHASLISIVVTLVLLAITVIFSVNFINVMKSEGLVQTNKIIYYLIILSPVIPFIFLIYLITRLVKYIPDEGIETNIIEENEKEIEKSDFHNNIEDNTKSDNNEEQSNQSKENKEEIELL